MNRTQPVMLLPAEETDINEIYRLCQEVAEKSPLSKWGKDYPNEAILTEDVKSRTLYKVVLDGRIVSIIQIRDWNDFMKNEEAEDTGDWDTAIHHPCGLGRFCVSPSLQGKGLGRQILTAALQKAYRMGYDGAFFHVVGGNMPALHLYDSMGFHYTGEVDEYHMHFLCYEMKLNQEILSA